MRLNMRTYYKITQEHTVEYVKHHIDVPLSGPSIKKCTITTRYSRCSFIFKVSTCMEMDWTAYFVGLFLVLLAYLSRGKDFP